MYNEETTGNWTHYLITKSNEIIEYISKFSNFVFIFKKIVNFSDVYSSLGSYRYTPRVGSPLSIDDPVQRVRQQNYISRWNDMFSQDRLDAMDTLRRYSDDYENNQRIIFLAIQVC